MGKEITITIDGTDVRCEEGEYILNAARANGIFIPAICYLTRCSPTLACRICLVEADGKQVYACNAKTKEGMNVTTSTETIESEKRAIMEVYDVNHPLQCGVCDQSGECELQNYTFEIGVDSQTYAIKDVDRPIQDWGHLHYDPGLCIVCERCVTVCKDMIGDNSLKTVPRGADKIDDAFKESMPKDAYAMWNKLNKSVIGLTSGGDMLDCTSCGECAAVCPVGALVDTDFLYTTNAWEQKKIPATCGHCSAGCQLNYETKHTSIENPDEKIYRTSNEWNYVSLCGAGRYGYDYENRGATQNTETFAKAIAAFKAADTIRFTSMITNEEALILQRLKEKYGYKLVNEEAKRFQDFMRNYSEISGKTLYSGDLKSVAASDFVVSIGSALKTDNPNARYAFNNSMKMNKGAGLYFHPVKDPVIEGLGKNLMSIYHAPLQEEAALYLILDLFGDKAAMPSALTDYLASFHAMKSVTVEETIKEKVTEIVKDEESGEEKEVSKMVPKTVTKEVEVDENALLSMLGAPADFNENLEKFLKKKEKFALMVGPDLFAHPNARNLARLSAMIEKYTDFDVVVIPEVSNTLGVSLICELDCEAGKNVIGYNAPGDFVLSALGDGDIDMPAMNQQEGTLTNINKRVTPTNAALAYEGYTLNDLANALGLSSELTIDYTVQLPVAKGFRSEDFDALPNHYTNAGEEVRGYALECMQTQTLEDQEVGPYREEMKLEGTMIYLTNPVSQFNAFTNKAHQFDTNGGLYVSEAHAKAASLNEGDAVCVKTDRGELRVNVIVDNKIDGDIAYLPTFDTNINSGALFGGYRFSNATIERV